MEGPDPALRKFFDQLPNVPEWRKKQWLRHARDSEKGLIHTLLRLAMVACPALIVLGIIAVVNAHGVTNEVLASRRQAVGHGLIVSGVLVGLVWNYASHAYFLLRALKRHMDDTHPVEERTTE